MGELVEKIKERLPLEELAQSAGVVLQRKGRLMVGCCPFHVEKTGSFTIFREESRFKCFGCGKSGDAIDFLALKRLGVSRPQGEQFQEVLKLACEAAGLDWDAETQGGRDAEKMKQRRRVGDVLTAYAELAAKSWTPECRARIKTPKPAGLAKTYLNDEVIERWSLGIAPTRGACSKAGISDQDLRLVGLLKPSQFKDGEEYLHFSNGLIIPHMRQGRANYLCLRTFKLDAKAKYVCMPAPGSPHPASETAARRPSPGGRGEYGGVDMPLAFNVEAFWSDAARLKGVLLVEGRLDAIACCEQGHPAVAYLSAPRAPFAKEAAKYTGTRLYFCPDATADMTALKRAEYAALFGPDALCCTLPAGLDPDEVDALGLERAKSEARDTVEEWLSAVA